MMIQPPILLVIKTSHYPLNATQAALEDLTCQKINAKGNLGQLPQSEENMQV
jgi:hypothetical protein